MSAILSAGYNVDFIDAEAIDTVGLGTHQILVIPPTDRIPVETAAQDSASGPAAGGKVICTRPRPHHDRRRQEPAPGAPRKPRSFDPRPPSCPMKQASPPLHAAVQPDLQLRRRRCASPPQLGFIRRKLPSGGHLLRRQHQQSDHRHHCHVRHQRQDRQLWNPDNASRHCGIRHRQPSTSPPTNHASSSSPTRRPPRAWTASPRRPAPPLADLSTDWKSPSPAATRPSPNPRSPTGPPIPQRRTTPAKPIYSRDLPRAAPARPSISKSTAASLCPARPTRRRNTSRRALGPDGLPNPLVTRTGPGMHAYYDPPIREAALVTINGQPPARSGTRPIASMSPAA